jgi:hypothetical protein
VSLVASILEIKLRELVDPDFGGFLGFPPDVDAAGDAWADAYDAYAINALDVSGDALVSANKAGFAGVLKSGLGPGVPAAAAATIFDNAFVAYWTGAIFAIGAPPPGTPPCPNSPASPMVSEVSSVVLMVTAGLLAGLLATEFGLIGDDGAAKAAALAGHFHTATTTAVLVLITGVDATPAPVTNLCTIS